MNAITVTTELKELLKQAIGPEPFLLDTRGMIWLLSGDPKKAQDDLQAASTASPSPVYW